MQYLRTIATTVNTHDNVKDVCTTVISRDLHINSKHMFNGKFNTNASIVSAIDSFHAV